jgi:uncharacterized protein
VLKVVLDTNVFVSSLLSRVGPPAKVLDAWREGKYLLVMSPAILTEIRKVLVSRRIFEKYHLVPQDLDDLLGLLENDSLIVPGNTHVAGAVPGDPQDEMFLSCALESGANLIVSGDHHLLDLGEYEGIPIVSVYEFFERLEKSKGRVTF